MNYNDDEYDEFNYDDLDGLECVPIIWYDNHAVAYGGVRNDIETYFDAKYDVHYRYKPCDAKPNVNNDHITSQYHDVAQCKFWGCCVANAYQVHKRSIGEKEKAVRVKAFKTKIIVYDFETVFNIDELSALHTYSISWIIKSEDKKCGPIADRGAFVLGATQEIVCQKFVDMLVEEQNDSLICLTGYNSSRFDNFFLIPELMKRDLLDDIMYQGNSILNIKWGGRHCSFDICRYTTGPLERVSTNFKCKFLKVSGFDHDVIQKHFNTHKRLNNYFHDAGCPQMDKEYCIEEYDFPTANAKEEKKKYEEREFKNEVEYYEGKPMACNCKKFRDLCVYNMFDVLSCMELYNKIEVILKDQEILHGEQRLYDKRTIGGAIYSKFAEDNKGKLPLLDLEQYKRARSGLVAGRVQCYGGARYDISGDNQYRMLDVKSLYPYVMLNRWYPAGEIVTMSYAESKKKELLGMFWVTLKQDKLRINVLPRRPTGTNGDMSLDWNFKDELKMFIPTVDIDCLIWAGADVTVHDEESIVFTERVHGSELFKCQEEFKKIKEGEDAKPKEERNNALREMSKLFLNSLSGKVIENLHVDKTELVRTDAQMKRIIESSASLDAQGCKKIPDMHLANQLSESAGIVKYKCSDEDVFKKDNRPIYLGILIYAYARDHMYRSILRDYDVIYQDTDSALIPLSEYEKFQENDTERMANEMEPLEGGEFGQFELEEGSDKMAKYVSVAAKNYFIMDKDNKLIKKGFKGVNLKPKVGDKLIRDINDPKLKPYISTEEFKRKAINGERERYDVYHLNPDTAYELYKKEIDKTKEESKDNWALKSVYEDVGEFIRQITTNGFAYVLCSYMKKNLGSGNVRDNSGSIIGVREPAMLYQQYMIKKITAKGFNV